MLSQGNPGSRVLGRLLCLLLPGIRRLLLIVTSQVWQHRISTLRNFIGMLLLLHESPGDLLLGSGLRLRLWHSLTVSNRRNPA